MIKNYQINDKSCKGAMLMCSFVACDPWRRASVKKTVKNVLIDCSAKPILSSSLVKDSAGTRILFMKGPYGIERYELKGHLIDLSRFMDGKHSIRQISRLMNMNLDDVILTIRQFIQWGIIYFDPQN